ncbi:hypothetical protein BDQ17DRAFT_1539502 [Cyathus striatus]|nr:hypothetical protein BDQ17DRAFT_1539502 [Cyathus striatus]
MAEKSNTNMLFANFNQDLSCISVGTRKGYCITNCDPFGRVYTSSASFFALLGCAGMLMRGWCVDDGARGIRESVGSESSSAVGGEAGYEAFVEKKGGCFVESKKKITTNDEIALVVCGLPTSGARTAVALSSVIAMHLHRSFAFAPPFSCPHFCVSSLYLFPSERLRFAFIVMSFPKSSFAVLPCTYTLLPSPSPPSLHLRLPSRTFTFAPCTFTFPSYTSPSFPTPSHLHYSSLHLRLLLLHLHRPSLYLHIPSYSFIFVTYTFVLLPYTYYPFLLTPLLFFPTLHLRPLHLQLHFPSYVFTFLPTPSPFFPSPSPSSPTSSPPFPAPTPSFPHLRFRSLYDLRFPFLHLHHPPYTFTVLPTPSPSFLHLHHSSLHLRFPFLHLHLPSHTFTICPYPTPSLFTPTPSLLISSLSSPTPTPSFSHSLRL